MNRRLQKIIDGFNRCSFTNDIYWECGDCEYWDEFDRSVQKGEQYDVVQSDTCNKLLREDAINMLKAYDFALSQYKETLEELVENNDGDVKEICVFLLNLLNIKEVDIERGFYI